MLKRLNKELDPEDMIKDLLESATLDDDDDEEEETAIAIATTTTEEATSDA